MLTISKLISICCLILAVIFAIICIISNIMLINERNRWEKYKQSNNIIKLFEMYDKEVLSSNKSNIIDIGCYKREYEEYKKHKSSNNKLCLLFTRSLMIFVIISFLFVIVQSHLN